MAIATHSMNLVYWEKHEIDFHTVYHLREYAADLDVMLIPAQALQSHIILYICEHEQSFLLRHSSSLHPAEEEKGAPPLRAAVDINHVATGSIDGFITQAVQNGVLSP